jgi:hypothetical protein
MAARPSWVHGGFMDNLSPIIAVIIILGMVGGILTAVVRGD